MNSRASGTRPTVIVIEDDEAVRESLHGLFRSVGLGVKQFASVEDLADEDLSDIPGCMVLDVRLPGKSGLAYYDDLVRAGSQRPVIFISGHADVPMSVRAMKAGAVEFLTKPVRDQDLLDAVHLAIERDRRQRESARLVQKLKQDLDSLSPREREVMGYVVAGFQNRQIAEKVGLSEGTVKLHRGNVMHKMQAGSLAELIRIADSLGMTSTK